MLRTEINVLEIMLWRKKYGIENSTFFFTDIQITNLCDATDSEVEDASKYKNHTCKETETSHTVAVSV